MNVNQCMLRLNTRRINMRTTIKLLLLLIPILFLVACNNNEFTYTGNYPDLYSVALNSVLGLEGFELSSPARQPRISLLEEDDYGRRLFSYSEASTIVAFLIIQKSDDVYAYFYPHYNFVIGSRNPWAFIDEDYENVKALKEANNWNREMSDTYEFVRVRISRQREVGSISNEKLIEVFYYLFPHIALDRPENIRSRMFYLRTDSYGRSIYSTGTGAVLFQPNHLFDSETGIFIFEERHNYQANLRLFMEANGWDTPFSD